MYLSLAMVYMIGEKTNCMPKCVFLKTGKANIYSCKIVQKAKK